MSGIKTKNALGTLLSFVFLVVRLYLIVAQQTSHVNEPSGSRTCWQKFAILKPKNIRISLSDQDQAGLYVWVTVKLWTSVIEATLQIQFIIIELLINTLYSRTKPKFIYFLVINNYISFIEIKT